MTSSLLLCNFYIYERLIIREQLGQRLVSPNNTFIYLTTRLMEKYRLYDIFINLNLLINSISR